MSDPLQPHGLSPQRRQWHPAPVLLPGKSQGWGSLVGCSPWGRWESDTTERLHFQFSLSCVGEGNGNPLQCSCLENPRGGGAWWAAVYGVEQHRTWLKWLSSSSSRTISHQTPLSPEFFRQEYWSGLPFPPPGDLPDAGIKSMSPVSAALAGRFFTSEPSGKLLVRYHYTPFRMAQTWNTDNINCW